MQIFQSAEVTSAARTAPSPQRGRKKERAGYGVCKEDREVVESKTGEANWDSQSKNVQTCCRAQGKEDGRGARACRKDALYKENGPQVKIKRAISHSDPRAFRVRHKVGREKKGFGSARRSARERQKR
jgi:hypothetical protein